MKNWKCILSDPEVICYQKANKQYAVRIEARHQGSGWRIYKSYYNDKGLNIIDSFEAKNREEMESLLGNLQNQKDPSLPELEQRMLKQKKSATMKIERAYKEYNVEKWYFTINDEQHKNVIMLRLYDAADVDFIVHKKYAQMEDVIVREALRMLGLQSTEEDISVSFYYFTDVKHKDIPAQSPSAMYEVDWFHE